MTTETRDDPAWMTEDGALVLQRWLPGPASRVWSYLVDGEKRRLWLAAGEMVAAPGAAFELTWRNDDLSHASDPRPDGYPAVQRLQGRVISVDPPHRLVIAWGAGEVSFDLVDRGDRVLLTLRHTGLAAGPARAEIAGGWHMHLEILHDRLAGRPAGSFWSGWARLRDRYAAQGASRGTTP
jgi:uncharacterized protein YndB with AHSA1/START domain